MTEDLGAELGQKQSLARDIAQQMADHNLTPLHVADNPEALARFEMIFKGEVNLIPFITLLRAAGSVQKAIAPFQVVEDD
ncbi:hypothetical protein V6R85_23960 [Agrobacterium sp. CCNWLW32]|uniref:hypothetical protein n=1 Tax=Agrobacterium sp. CCNWLW32 TaxID=3122072 RepID=UPI00300F9D51